MTFDSSNIMDFKSALTELRQATPGIPLREAALELGTSEGDLLAAHCGEGVVRLDGNWDSLLRALGALGPWITLTRNDQAVIQSLGNYPTLGMLGSPASAPARRTSLSLHLEAWTHGFAVAGSESDSWKQSLQFFDDSGTAVHKAFLPGSDAKNGLEWILGDFRHQDQSPLPERMRGASPRLPPQAPIFGDASPLPLWRVDVRAIGGMLLEAASKGLSCRASVSSSGARQTQQFQVATLQRRGPWLRILDPLFNLSILIEGLGTAWVAQDPDPEEGPYLLQLLGAKGGAILELRSSAPAWNELLYTLPVWEA